MNDEEIDEPPPGTSPPEEHLRGLMRAACKFAIRGEHESARVCLDLAQFIIKTWHL